MLFGPDGGSDSVFLRTATQRIGGAESAECGNDDSNDQKDGFVESA